MFGYNSGIPKSGLQYPGVDFNLQETHVNGM